MPPIRRFGRSDDSQYPALASIHFADYIRHYLVAPSPVIIDGEFTSQAHSASYFASSEAVNPQISERVCPDSLTICTCSASLRGRAPVSSERKRPRRIKDRNRIPRPRNAFMVFRSYYIKFLKAKVKDDGLSIADGKEPTSDTKKVKSLISSQNELSKIAARQWNDMGADERKPFVEEATKEKEMHKTMYPDYVYHAPSAVGQKVKSLKIVETGNPSKDRGRSDERKKAAAHGPGQQKPWHSSHEVIDTPRQWAGEDPSQRFFRQSIGAEKGLIPTESCVPFNGLYLGKQEFQIGEDFKLKVCQPGCFPSLCLEFLFIRHGLIRLIQLRTDALRTTIP